MPIGRVPSASTSAGSFVIPGTTANGAIRAGAAVAVVLDGVDAVVEECSATSNGNTFAGFAAKAVADGEVVAVVTFRGSTVTPIVEGGGSLTTGDLVFLSDTLGEVVHTAPSGAGSVVVPLGVAVSATELFISTDARYGISV